MKVEMIKRTIAYKIVNGDFKCRDDMYQYLRGLRYGLQVMYGSDFCKECFFVTNLIQNIDNNEEMSRLLGD